VINLKGFGRRRWWLIQGTILALHGGTEKTIKDGMNTWYPGRDSNQTPL
jgi:hypothetical protein